MTPSGRYRWQAQAFYSLLGFSMAVVCFMNMDPQAGVVAEGDLLKASGRVAWIQEYKYGTRFGLVGIDKRFNYPSKANGMGAVRDALKYAGEKNVLIRYELETHGPIYSDDEYHDVWELNVGGRAIRTYNETAVAWKSDNQLVPWLGGAMSLCGISLGIAAWRTRRSANQFK